MVRIPLGKTIGNQRSLPRYSKFLSFYYLNESFSVNRTEAKHVFCSVDLLFFSKPQAESHETRVQLQLDVKREFN